MSEPTTQTEPKAAPAEPATTKPQEAVTASPVEPAKDPKPDPAEVEKLQELQEKLAEYQAKERAAEEAKLSEAEKLKAERQRLDAERFLLSLEKAGVPDELAAHFTVPTKDHAEHAAKLAKSFEKWRAAERKRITDELKSATVGQPAGPAGTDQTRTGSQTRTAAPVMSLMQRPSAVRSNSK